MYQVLARKHRPQTFDDLFGQDAVAQTLKNALSSKKLAHAYLLFGPRGTGKTTTARILAKALNCAKGPTPEPCLKCAACAEIASGRALDVLEIDAATHTQVDKVREVIIETVALAPARDRYKVFIIDEAHMLSTSAFNALLKTLEEPPAHVVFMLATTEQQKIPATIFSRCQRYRFRLQGVPVIVEYLKKVAKLEKFEAELKALELLAKAADGSMRDAVSLLDQAAAFSSGPLKEAAVRELLGQLPELRLEELARAVLARDARALGGSFAAAVEEGQDPATLLKELRSLFHGMYAHRMGLAKTGKPWSALADGAEPAALAFVLRRLARGVEELRGTDQVRLSVELTLFGLLEAPYDLREWVGRLEALEARLAKGEASPQAAGRGPQATGPTASSTPHPTLSQGRGNKETKPAPLSPQPSAPRSQHPAPSTQHPAPGTQNPVPDPAVNLKSVWPKVVAAVAVQRPALGRYLQLAQFESTGGHVLLSFVSNFALESVKQDLSFIQQALAASAGATVAIELRQDRDAAPMGIGPVAAPEPPPQDEPEAEGSSAKWKPVTGDDPLKADPGIQKALKVFSGKVYKPKT